MKFLFLAVIVVGVYFLFSKKRKEKIGSPKMQSAMQRLNERFVNGEIDEDTFKQIKETIN